MPEHRPRRSAGESTVEEENSGFAIPYKEEEGSVGDELEGSGSSPKWNPADGDGSGRAGLSASLVHVDVRLMEHVQHPQSRTAGDASQIGPSLDEQILDAQSLQ